MSDTALGLLGSSFMPHGFCLRWIPSLLWTHIAADALIAIAYFSIPGTIVYYLLRRKLPAEVMLRYGWIGGLFAAFILLCGITHIFGIITMWQPVYGVQSLLKAATAVVSLFTAIALIQLMPLLLALRSPDELEAEIQQRQNREKELQRVNLRLQDEVLAKERAQDAQREAMQALQNAVHRRSHVKADLAHREEAAVLVARQLLKMLQCSGADPSENKRATEHIPTLLDDLKSNLSRDVDLGSLLPSLLALLQADREQHWSLDCPANLRLQQPAGDLSASLLLWLRAIDQEHKGTEPLRLEAQLEQGRVQLRVFGLSEPPALDPLRRIVSSLRDCKLDWLDEPGVLQCDWPV